MFKVRSYGQNISIHCSYFMTRHQNSHLLSPVARYLILTCQVTSEIEDPIHPVLGGVVSGKVGIICETVLSEFKELVSMCGGPNEKLRAEYLLKHLM